jgi:hypothetical protein
MAASHQEMFKCSTIDEEEILELLKDKFLPLRAVLQWRPAKDEDILTPNTHEIVVLKPFSRGASGSAAATSSTSCCRTSKMSWNI